MSSNSKLYVFEKKEVLLLFVFMILIALTSFLLGMKLGKSFSLDKAGITEADKQRVELQSTTEETVKLDEMDPAAKNLPVETQVKEQFDESYKKLKEEFNKLKEKEAATLQEDEKSVLAKDSYIGKYTIQLGSYRALNDSEKFAEGFRARGYNPIINEVKIQGQGIWYRVSLGVFDTLQEAKEYIVREKSLFQDQDYVIGRFE